MKNDTDLMELILGKTDDNLSEPSPRTERTSPTSQNKKAKSNPINKQRLDHQRCDMRVLLCNRFEI